MRLMNQQTGRAGKIQVELGRDQVRQLIGWLYLAAVGTLDPKEKAAIVERATWLQHRYFRRWGDTDFETQPDRRNFATRTAKSAVRPIRDGTE